MLDTISLESPSIPSESLISIESFCKKFIGLEVSSGEKLYEFTSGELEGSHDSRISIQLKTERLDAVDTVISQSSREHKKIVRSVPCDPYLKVECSIHKLMLGHNVFGGPTDFLASATYLINFLQKTIGVTLPDPCEWIVRRIDVACIFDLGSPEAVEEWLREMKHSYFPRRTVIPYPTSIYVPGRSTTLKCYHKGPEFSKHDFKRLRFFTSIENVKKLQEKAYNILRFEVEIHSKKLRDDFGNRLPKVNEITGEYLIQVYDKEVFKLLREAQEPDQTEVYRTSEAVLNRLSDLFCKRTANSLFSTWIKLATLGEEKVKDSMSKPTFYRHRKQLIESNISWFHSDISLNKKYSVLPEDFKPLRSDPRCLVAVHPFILNQLKIA